MKKEILKQYKKILLEERENVIKEIMDSDESARDLLENDSHNVNDSVDEASSKLTQTLLTIISNNHQQKVLAIEAALRRIVEGTFGNCVACSKEIEKKRLAAVPWATKCIKCKNDDDKKN